MTDRQNFVQIVAMFSVIPANAGIQVFEIPRFQFTELPGMDKSSGDFPVGVRLGLLSNL
jgi:hypothetical protein